MSLNEKCKENGLSIAEVAKIAGTHRVNLHNWEKKKPVFLNVIIEGAKAIKEKNSEGK